MNKAVSVLIITLIEAVAFAGGVGIWFALRDVGAPAAGLIFGTAFWTLVTYLEHFAAQNLGWGNPLFRGFPFFINKT